jgi:hypothetical protein
VPCRISTAGLMDSPLDALQVEYPIALVDCQGERGRIGTGVAEAQWQRHREGRV